MADSNKVVLKINYQGKNKKLDKSNPPKMVTEWNIKRILIALVIVILFITLLLVFISDQPIDSNVEKKISENKEPEQLSSVIKKPIPENITPTTVINNDNKIDNNKQRVEEILPVLNIKHPSKASTENISVDPTIKKTEIEITKNVINLVDDKEKKLVEKKQTILEFKPIQKPYKKNSISRALLASRIVNREPVDNMGNILKVDNNGLSTAYYFTEIINMKGITLYHHWLRNGQTIFKRKIKIRGNRWRVSTSKRILYSQAGGWNVRLVDEEGVILNEIQFDVIQN